jgi:hypothetical protein
MAYRDVPALMAHLREDNSIVARALAFTILMRRVPVDLIERARESATQRLGISRPQYGSDHLRGQRGLLLASFQRVRPIAGYDCSSDWTPLLAETLTCKNDS